MKTLNMMGQACPIPVIEAKNLLQTEDNLKVLVDNEIATKNLTKLGQNLNYDVKINQKDTDKYEVIFKKSDNTKTGKTTDSTGYTVVIETDIMGRGDDTLGTALMKSFVYALAEQEQAPERILFYNGGVKLACTGSDSLEDLNGLVDRGTEILVCGACLDFYDLTEDLAIGEISNMYSIVEAMRTSSHIVKP